MAGLSASIPLLGDVPASTSGPPPAVVYEVTVADAVTTGDADAYVWRPGAIVTERTTLRPDLTANGKYGGVLTDGQRMTDALGIAMPLVLGDAVTISDATIVINGLVVIDGLRLAATPDPAARYARMIAERLWMSDVARAFFGAEVVDSMVATDALAVKARLPGTLSDGVSISELLGHSLILRVTAAEDIEITADQALQMLYRPEIIELIDVAAAYVSPGGGITTWAVNTLTGAVSEYTNYQFNSFAKHGQRYVGACDTGLYELDGDDDQGEDIIARIKTGFVSFASTHVSQFKAAYLAVRGGGDYVLRVILPNGAQYDYAVRAEDSRSTKIKIGKGLRARYFAFELISTGQDFDLDMLEFVPIIADRRV